MNNKDFIIIRRSEIKNLVSMLDRFGLCLECDVKISKKNKLQELRFVKLYESNEMFGLQKEK